MAKSCAACGTTFLETSSPVRKYCDWRCRNEYKQSTAELVSCQGCSEKFRPKHTGARYCSRPCWLGVYNVEDAEHSQAGGIAGGEVNRRRRYGTGSKTYRKLGGRHEHRVIAEQKIGRPLREGEIVHHKDENHLNNHPDNLVVLVSRQAHGWIHDILRRSRG